ncbi:DUF6518 family protein [Nocardioides scoriae]|uniref:DUF6518 family protein n=1 Tax=Nocardioides scoriae TaxID=642780 RepID=UPI000B87EC7D|nr:DUF6518 family protein [Nocardioides scoriae]
MAEPTPSPARSVARVATVLVVAGLAGAATSLLQTVLPAAVASFANSAGSWCLVAWLLARPAGSAPRGAAVAVLALVALVAGYYAVAHLRGFSVSPGSVGFWLVAAATVGPVLGVGAVWSRRARGWRRVLGALVLPGLLVAEAAYGLALLRASTSTGYWATEGLVGVGLGVALVAERTTARARRRVAAVFAESDNPGWPGTRRLR